MNFSSLVAFVIFFSCALRADDQPLPPLDAAMRAISVLKENSIGMPPGNQEIRILDLKYQHDQPIISIEFYHFDREGKRTPLYSATIYNKTGAIVVADMKTGKILVPKSNKNQ